MIFLSYVFCFARSRFQLGCLVLFFILFFKHNGFGRKKSAELEETLTVLIFQLCTFELQDKRNIEVQSKWCQIQMKKDKHRRHICPCLSSSCFSQLILWRSNRLRHYWISHREVGLGPETDSHNPNMRNMFVQLLFLQAAFLPARSDLLCSVAILWRSNRLRHCWISHPSHSRGLQQEAAEN